MYTASKSAKFENERFEEIKKDFDDLHKHNLIFDELENSALFETENSMHIENNDFIQSKSLISEIKEQEITNKLNSLIYNVGWLKSAIIIKDNNIINRTIKNIMKHEHYSITAIVSELNSLKNNIDKFENLHEKLLNSDFSLDTKTLLEQDFREKHKKLNDIHNKQKNILLNLSSVFVKLTKDSVIKKKS